MKRIIGATLAVATCSIGLAVGAQAANGGKVSICHGTASDKNPYVLINVSENALGGHLDGTGPGHGKNSHPDFLLPAGQSDCAAVPGGDDGDGGSDGGDGGGDGEF
jgi:hypothetical protein